MEIVSDNKETLEYLKNLVLNKRDLAAEELLQIIINDVLASSPELAHVSSDEKNNLIMKKTFQELHNLSPALTVKITPLIKSVVEKTTHSILDESLATITIKPTDQVQKALIYRRMLGKMINDESVVSFAFTNNRLVNKMAPRDVFLLTLFTFVTCKRSRNDELGQLFISGLSSCGKSTLIESVISASAHQLVTSISKQDPGVGRFNTQGRNVMLLRDCVVSSMLSSDSERLKTICRSEPTVAKIHSSTQTLEPIFLLASSNERLHTHRIAVYNSLPKIYSSHLLEHANNKKIHIEHVFAIQNRFIEMLIRSKPKQLEEDLNNADGFDRFHFILAVMPIVVNILESTQESHFPSKYLKQYVCAGIQKYLPFYINSFKNDDILKQWATIPTNN